MIEIDYSNLGLKVGLEVHQQLATRRKLFCHCSYVQEKDFRKSFVRRLRPTQSELGQIDPAALFEFRKGTLIKYYAGLNSCCTVEADEEPPHELNEEAVESVVLIALTLNARVLDELHTMRKIVIDGSNTTGFQRTLTVGLGGSLEVDGTIVGVQSVTLEEDAARLIKDSKDMREYALDRLGLPLVEIASEPIPGEPQKIQEAALVLGRLLRATKRVARGLGTIRQDLNISILGGSIVEVKGVQKLNLLSKIIEYEAARQLGLLEISKELQRRSLRRDDLLDEPVNLTDLLRNSGSNTIKRAIEGHMEIWGLKLRGFKGLLGREPFPDVRLGKEMAELVRFYGPSGIFHSDELPNYGITEIEVSDVKRVLNADEADAFVLLGGRPEIIQEALEAVKTRAKEAIHGVPAETRAPTAEGKTRFLRPRPGAARMYPETDISPIVITENMLDTLAKQKPRPWEEEIENLVNKYALSRKLAEDLYDSDFLELFKELASKTRVSPSFIGATLVETTVSLVRDGLDVSRLDEENLMEIFRALDEERISKEAVVEIMEMIAELKASTVEEALKKLGFKKINIKELEGIIDEVISMNRQPILQKGENAFGTLMGKVMEEVRGRVDGQLVSSTLRKKIAEILKKR